MAILKSPEFGSGKFIWSSIKRFAATGFLAGGHLSLQVGDGGCTTMATESMSCSALPRPLSHHIHLYRNLIPERPPSVRRTSLCKVFEETSNGPHQIYLRTLDFEVHNCSHEVLLKGYDCHERHLRILWYSVGWPASCGTSESKGRVQD